MLFADIHLTGIWRPVDDGSFSRHGGMTCRFINMVMWWHLSNRYGEAGKCKQDKNGAGEG